jgi:hypothetical protein
MPLSHKLDHLNYRIDEHNEFMRKVWATRTIQAAYFDAQVYKSLLLIAAIFAAIIIAAFVIPDLIGYVAIMGFVASFYPVVQIERVAGFLFSSKI